MLIFGANLNILDYGLSIKYTSLVQKGPNVLIRNDQMLDIVYEDDDIIVINKPPGIAVHPVKENDSKITVVRELIDYYPPIKKVGENQLRPGIVHRIDADTSGILVAAKNQKTFSWLKNKFASREVEKHYLAIVEGRMSSLKGTFKGKLGRIGGKFRLIDAGKLRPHEKLPEKLREAETEFKVLKRFQDATLVLLSPKTGRTHQLRVQLSAAGHPILGDKLYDSKTSAMRAERQMLHALSLTVSMPDGKRISLEAEPPYDFQNTLNDLSKRDEENKIEKNETHITYE